MVGALALAWLGSMSMKMGATDGLGTFAMDVVVYGQSGQELKGDSRWSTVYEDYTYWFSSERNLNLFLADPGRFAVQLGGACGRMGPLSGRGETSRMARFNGQLFIFASDACRDAFMARPSQFLQTPDPEPAYDAENYALAMDKIVNAREATVTPASTTDLTIEVVRFRADPSNPNSYRTTQVFSPLGYQDLSSWDGKTFEWKWVPEGARRPRVEYDLPNVFQRDNEGKIMGGVAAAERELSNAWAANPISFLVAWPFSVQNKFALNPDGTVQIHRAGTLITVTFDPESKLPKSVAYRGRRPNSTWGNLNLVIDGWGDYERDGVKVKLPNAWHLMADGNQVDAVKPADLEIRVR